MRWLLCYLDFRVSKSNHINKFESVYIKIHISYSTSSNQKKGGYGNLQALWFWGIGKAWPGQRKAALSLQTLRASLCRGRWPGEREPGGQEGDGGGALQFGQSVIRYAGQRVRGFARTGLSLDQGSAAEALPEPEAPGDIKEMEFDEMWHFIGSKKQALDHQGGGSWHRTNRGLGYRRS